jgi:hypothetical protein
MDSLEIGGGNFNFKLKLVICDHDFEKKFDQNVPIFVKIETYINCTMEKVALHLQLYKNCPKYVHKQLPFAHRYLYILREMTAHTFIIKKPALPNGDSF